jgi:hypothetical protein
MKIPELGTLERHPSIEEWLCSEPIPVPLLFGQSVVFTLDGLEASDEHDTRVAIAAFLALDEEARREASKYVFENYLRMKEMVDDDSLGCDIADQNRVWEHVRFTEVFVRRRHRRDRSIYVSVMAECDWEIEHGLQVVFHRGSRLSRVSDQDGHITYADAYDTPEEEDQIA